MELYVKNVKFGDSCSIYSDKDSYLIDCGSCNASNSPKIKKGKFAYSQIEDEINDKKLKNLMISHYDIDHFNGILEIPDTYSFDNVYLPFSIVNGHAIYSKTIGVLLAIAPTRSWGFTLSKQIVELFKKLPKISKKIVFVKRGDYIDFSKEQIRILWPEIEKIENSYQSILSNADLDNQQYSEWINLINSFTDNFDSYIVGMHNNYKNNDNHDLREKLVAFEESYNNLLNARDQIFNDSYYQNNKESIHRFCYNKYHDLIKTMNAISIICDCQKHFIFFGDAPKKIVKYLKDDYRDIYNVVKIPHHATKQYYTNYIPKGLNYIISNGGYKSRYVDERFLAFNGNFICTQKNSLSKNCKYYSCNGFCHSNCNDIKTCPVHC